jgi:cyclophilin family peptidyl-prolyl cis-trans isomerase
MTRLLTIVVMFGLLGTVAAKPVRPGPMNVELAALRVIMETNHGKIILELYADKAPVTVKNFLHYVDERFYDGMIFHRVIPNFMIQGGGMMPGVKEKPGRAPIKSEAKNGLLNERGTIAVARAVDPNSGTSQFFINTRDNAFLNPDKAHDKVGYCVFGRVVEGMDVVDRIASVKTHAQGGHNDVPVQDVVILSVRRVGS